MILNLCHLNQEALLPILFQDILAPPEVKMEFQRLAVADGRFAGLAFPEFIRIVHPRGVAASLRGVNSLHAGEIAAISLAVEQNADAILVDEQAGRSAATELGLNCIGLLGVLLQAKRSGHIPDLAPLLDRLQHEARFWISPTLRQQVLKFAGEDT